MSSCLVWTQDPPLHYLHAELATARADHAMPTQLALAGLWEPRWVALLTVGIPGSDTVAGRASQECPLLCVHLFQGIPSRSFNTIFTCSLLAISWWSGCWLHSDSDNRSRGSGYLK